MTPEERARHFVVGSAGGDFDQDGLIRLLAYEFHAAVAEERGACARLADAAGCTHHELCREEEKINGTYVQKHSDYCPVKVAAAIRARV